MCELHAFLRSGFEISFRSVPVMRQFDDEVFWVWAIFLPTFVRIQVFLSY